GAPGAPGAPQAQKKQELDKYPHVEKDLPLVQKALAEMKGKNPADIARPPEMFDADQFNVFQSRPDSPLMGGGAGEGEGAGGAGPGMSMSQPGGGFRGSGPGVGMPPRPGAPAPPRPGSGEGKPGGGAPGTYDPNQDQAELPEYCFVRLVDVTVQPGKIY